MDKYTTSIPSDFDAEKSFKKADRMVMKYLEKNQEDGQMAMISLARALGVALVLITEERQRDMALASVISEMCKSFADFLQIEADEQSERLQ